MRDTEPSATAAETDEYPSLSSFEAADDEDWVDVYSDVHERPTLVP
jgi:hypothetical protein